MQRAFTTASGFVLTVLATALAWLLTAGASVAAAGGPNPLYLRSPHTLTPPSSTSALTVTVVLVAVLLGAAVLFALLQRRADRRATLAEVASLDARREQDERRKAA
jgi:hypothetical protein